MTKLTTTSLPDFYKQTVGFDRLFNDLERAFTGPSSSNVGYPPYNIAKTDTNKYLISIAVAGFAMENLEITQDGNWLTVTGSAPEQNDDDITYIHRGLAGRSFERKFQIADHIEVQEAKLELGVLNIYLEQIIPEELLPRRIEIK
jgi:molecular chaperone IbpA